MARVFAAEDGTRFFHHLLDERVADSCSYGGSPGCQHALGDRLGTDQIVDDGGAGLAAEEPVRNQRRCGGSRERNALIVDEERAIGVTVECDPEIRVFDVHQRQQVGEILGPEGISRMIRECAVGFKVKPDQARREALERRRQSDSRHPVSAVRRHRQLRERIGINHGEEMVDVALEDPHVFNRTGRRRRGLRSGLRAV